MNKLRHETTNYKALYPFIAGMDGENNYRKFTSGEYMPREIEWIYCSDYKGRQIFSRRERRRKKSPATGTTVIKQTEPIFSAEKSKTNI